MAAHPSGSVILVVVPADQPADYRHHPSRSDCPENLRTLMLLVPGQLATLISYLQAHTVSNSTAASFKTLPTLAPGLGSTIQLLTGPTRRHC